MFVVDNEISWVRGASVLALILGFGQRPIVSRRGRRCDGSVRGDTHVGKLGEDLMIFRGDGSGGVVPCFVRNLGVPGVDGVLQLLLLHNLMIVIVNKRGDVGDSIANGDGEELHGGEHHGGLDGGGTMPDLFWGLNSLEDGTADLHLFLR